MLIQVDRIIFCVFMEVDYKYYCKYLHYIFPVEVSSRVQQLQSQNGIYIMTVGDIWCILCFFLELSIAFDMYFYYRKCKSTRA